MARRIKEGIKRREKNPASNQFPVINSERFTEFHREEKREEGDRHNQEERRGSQKERDQSSL